MITTARELMLSNNGEDYTHFEEIEEIMIEFAKLHVKAALEAVAEKSEVNIFDGDGSFTKGRYVSNGKSYTVDKQSILNSYPEILIK